VSKMPKQNPNNAEPFEPAKFLNASGDAGGGCTLSFIFVQRGQTSTAQQAAAVVPSGQQPNALSRLQGWQRTVGVTPLEIPTNHTLTTIISLCSSLVTHERIECGATVPSAAHSGTTHLTPQVNIQRDTWEGAEKDIEDRCTNAAWTVVCHLL
jgi:hypothetical protein